MEYDGRTSISWVMINTQAAASIRETHRGKLMKPTLPKNPRPAYRCTTRHEKPLETQLETQLDSGIGREQPGCE